VSFLKKIFQSNSADVALKKTEHKDGESDGVFISQQQIGWGLAVFLLLSFFIFIAGYFLGQQRAVEQFSSHVDQESLADKIYTSLYSLHDKQDESVAVNQVGDDTSEVAHDGLSDATIQAPEIDAQKTQVQEQVDQESTVSESPEVQHARYYAQLAGFGAHKNAIIFARKLERKGIPATVRTRYSRTARGKKIAWYQVITDEYTSEKQLQELVEKLKQEERLQDVRIVAI
jgi:hypothetical protein